VWDRRSGLLSLSYVLMSGLGEATGRNKDSLTRFFSMQCTHKGLNFFAPNLSIVPMLGL
jgi:hypothetical protein